MTDPNCIFCKIAAGDIPCTKVFESVDALAFMDIGPLAEGHVLLIPKQHYATIDEMPAEGAALLMGHIPALVRAVQAVTGCEGVNVLQNNGKAAHQEVPHVHVHIIPRTPGDAFGFTWPAGSYPEGRAGELATAIARELR